MPKTATKRKTTRKKTNSKIVKSSSKGKHLVLVESPSKAKTIGKYLGPDYRVLATVGHIIDLPKNKLGVDVEDGSYEPDFITIKGKAAVIKKIKSEIDPAKEVYLAMDPDREGEAIAWHAANALKLKNPKRIVFHEITKNAVRAALEKPREVDENLVKAQIARRVLDRLVGYKVSQLLWTKIWYGLSAGRVQSVALRLIVEREEEIENFKPEEYWDLSADLKNGVQEVTAKLARQAGKKAKVSTGKQANEIESDVVNQPFKVKEIKTRQVKKSAFPPFTTSTLQQAANNVLGYTAKRTMSLAQELYQKGIITYMRTDSVNLSQDAIAAIREHVATRYGERYLPATPNYYRNKSKNAQEAHEAIRPTDFTRTYEMVKEEVGPQQARLYSLIMNRAVSSQMAPRESEIKSVIFEVIGKSSEVYEFTLGAEKVLFDGFRKVLSSGSVESEENLQKIDEINEGDIYDLVKFNKVQQFTKPKARYTDASLVKALESYGVGRPSTYATIISTVQDRGYVEKRERYLHPLDVGRVVNSFLTSNFDRLVNYEYTANVEDELDAIAEGAVKYAPFIDKEYQPLIGEIKKVDKSVNKEDVVVLEKSNEKCDICGSVMVVKLGKYGKFLSCSKFPDCKGIKSLDGGEQSLDQEKYHLPEKCPECGSKMVLKNGKYGKFWACDRYPDCKGVLPMLLNETCPECGKHLVERKGRWGKMFTGCSGYPDCRYIKKEPKKAKDSEE